MAQQLVKQRYVIAGGSGFLGTSLARYLTERGAEVVVLSRQRSRVTREWQYQWWDGTTVGDWAAALDGADGLVNLAGRSVNCVKTPDRADEILRSRVESTRVLGEALRRVDAPPPVWVQMSTAHIYGDPPRARCTESSSFGYGLAPFVGRAWEERFWQSVLPSQRAVVLRTSFVLGRDHGAGASALGALVRVTRWGLGGTVGHGQQGISWIHELDMNRLFEASLVRDSMQGVYIASAPNPVSQRDFMGALRRVLGVPLGLPAPAWLLRIAVPIFLRTDPELILYGRYVLPERLEREGFEFRFSSVSEALRDLLLGQSNG